MNVLPYFKVKVSDVGSSVLVSSGKVVSKLVITDMMVGYRFGEFVLTKRLGSAIHVKKSKKSGSRKKNG